KRHVLQFALATGVAHGTIQGMVPQQQLDHGFARLPNLIRIRGDDHAVSNLHRAGSLQLGHFFDAYQAHATRSLERQPGVIAKRRALNADSLASLNQQSAGWSSNVFAVYRDRYVFYIRHKNLFTPKPGVPLCFPPVRTDTAVPRGVLRTRRATCPRSTLLGLR